MPKKSPWASPYARRPIAKKLLQMMRILTGGVLPPGTVRCLTARHVATVIGKRALAGETTAARKKPPICRKNAPPGGRAAGKEEGFSSATTPTDAAPPPNR